MTSLAGFKVLPVKFSKDCLTHNEIFYKENMSRIDSTEKPLGRTLFVVNVPPYTTKESIKSIFDGFGSVQSVSFQCSVNNTTELNDGFKSAFVVFKNIISVNNAKFKKVPALLTNDSYVSNSVKQWLENYNQSFYDHNELQETIDLNIFRYDKELEEQKKIETKKVQDDEGWTVISKSGRNPGVSRKESVNKQISKKKRELKNFYSFQIRESKMKNLAELRKKYEEDKKKINAMKQARKFKPF